MDDKYDLFCLTEAENIEQVNMTLNFTVEFVLATVEFLPKMTTALQC